MFDVSPKVWQQNFQAATTGDLLDRLTVYRPGMEPEALRLIEQELLVRGWNRADIEAHAREYESELPLLRHADGSARECVYCRRPALVRRWQWYWIKGRVPLFPQRVDLCYDHGNLGDKDTVNS